MPPAHTSPRRAHAAPCRQGGGEGIAMATALPPTHTLLTTISETKYIQSQNEWASCTKYIIFTQPARLITCNIEDESAVMHRTMDVTYHDERNKIYPTPESVRILNIIHNIYPTFQANNLQQRAEGMKRAPQSTQHSKEQYRTTSGLLSTNDVATLMRDYGGMRLTKQKVIFHHKHPLLK